MTLLRGVVVVWLGGLALAACLPNTRGPTARDCATAQTNPAQVAIEDCPGCALRLQPAADASMTDASSSAAAAASTPLATVVGEAMLLVNGRLTDGEAFYKRNVMISEADERIVGAALYLYHPDHPGELVKVGHLVFPPDPDFFDGARKLQIRDIAYHPTHGLWVLGLEPKNDEWRLFHVDVTFDADWRNYASSQALYASTSYALRAKDAAYWENALVGMAFWGDHLMIGGRGQAGRGTPGGAVYLLDVPQKHGVEPAYPEDPCYYVEANLSRRMARLPSQLGVAGDFVVGAGGELYVLARSEHQSARPLDANYLYRFESDARSQTAKRSAVGWDADEVEPDATWAPADTGMQLTITPNQDFQGLARLGGFFYAVNTWGQVVRADPNSGDVAVHDDLSKLFVGKEAGIHLRGATTIPLVAAK